MTSHFLKAAAPFCIRSVNQVYQESYLGTESSDLFYPIVSQVYLIGTSLAHEDVGLLNHCKGMVQGAILVCALSLGAIRGKNLSLIVGEIAIIHVSRWMAKKSKSGGKEILLAMPAIAIMTNLARNYLVTLRNKDFSVKPNYFFSVAYPLFDCAKTFFLQDYLMRQMKKLFGDEKCSTIYCTRDRIAENTLSSLVLPLLVAKCTTLVVGESLKRDWTAESIATVMSGACWMYRGRTPG